MLQMLHFFRGFWNVTFFEKILIFQGKIAILTVTLRDQDTLIANILSEELCTSPRIGVVA